MLIKIPTTKNSKNLLKTRIEATDSGKTICSYFSAPESVLDPPGWPPDPPGSIENSQNKIQNL